jgi:LmbE family N-acetylglucosaminyl deacetylase
MTDVLVVAPHPDDETLGCGATLLRHRAEGDAIHWVIVTEMRAELGHTPEQMARRQAEIKAVADRYQFASLCALALPTMMLDTLPMREVVSRMGEVFQRLRPSTVYLPFPGDAHTDHRVAFDAAMACCKWFRAPFVRRVLSYETLSESDANLDPESIGFRPNVFVDAAAFIEEKIAVLELYRGETGEFPFPRSARAVRALADLRGATCGFKAAEAFMLLRESI